MKLMMINKQWIINFHNHKPLSFSSKEDLEKYLNGELSNEHGYMEYERVPDNIEQRIYYDIDWET